MKGFLAIALLLSATASQAQELDRRPDAPKTNDLTVPATPYPLVQKLLYPNTLIPDGMVWVPRGEWWHAEELNSCAWCGKPMTFKQAAFDKKMSLMFLVETALTVADIESGQSCLKTGRCKEGNPLLGRGSRPMQYAIRLTTVGVMWINSAWARKGNSRLHVGGLKLWYIAPIVMHAEAVVGIVSGVRH
jgi:hypothetical protein